MKYEKGLDTLRAFAIIFVIIEHWWLPFDINPNGNVYLWIKGLIPDGGFGVDLFFVLSGFLITTILLKGSKGNYIEKFTTLKNFIIRRALRIFPIYYLTILILVLMSYPFFKDSLFWISCYMSNILVYNTQNWFNFAHSWSLSVEEQFYILWPWLIIFIKEKNLIYIFIFAIIVGIFTSFYTIIFQNNWAGFVLMPSCMQAFGIGGLYAYLVKKEKLKLFLKIINIIFPVALFLHFFWSFNVESGKHFSSIFLTINCVISIWIIHRVLTNKSIILKKYLFENFLLNKIGQVSYGIYLYHGALGFVYEKTVKFLFVENNHMMLTLLDWKNAFYIKLVLLGIIALSSYYFIERPILKLKDKFQYKQI